MKQSPDQKHQRLFLLHFLITLGHPSFPPLPSHLCSISPWIFQIRGKRKRKNPMRSVDCGHFVHTKNVVSLPFLGPTSTSSSADQSKRHAGCLQWSAKRGTFYDRAVTDLSFRKGILKTSNSHDEQTIRSSFSRLHPLEMELFSAVILEKEGHPWLDTN